ncbi:type III secretion system export apparatus subunit SctV [Enterobacter asburiae]|uniref:type III secretion system export apparatus subunit SctV n=1 Tax=Enterobacter asburiae TaxID=61645 RepID=UPI002006ADB1|nr:type III secretion system export apparatus subunit SctV [Enterobacter asburiae]MCK7227223.1 type III secretion system export apparatus subunit SctV [Enterobacter asburiae]
MMKNVSLNGINKLAKQQGIILAAILIMAVFMMILPLPTPIVDALITFNLMFALILLMVVVYLNNVVEFSVFPALLLITTLYRLSLTVSTSRLILLQHDAGEIVFAFGNFVVGGNLAVGLIIYAIITIVQFIVITKGSERVAEVSARFSLDGMPGKQMSIDGDLRAGSITTEQASALREKVQQESKLYGAMDGAMKFVKGDAIASIIVILVNIFGGMAIGVMHEGMSASEALTTYSILSVGDGLVAQIPALLISITAGILVTRVPGVASEQNLAGELFGQLGNRSAPLFIASAVLIIFALIPGFPAVVLVPMAAIVGGIGFFIRKHKKESAAATAENGSDSLAMTPGVAPVSLQVGSAVPREELNLLLEGSRWRIFEQLGLVLGPLSVTTLNPEQDDAAAPLVHFCLYNEPVVTLSLNTDTPDLLKPGGKMEPPPGAAHTMLMPGVDLYWLDDTARQQAIDAGETIYQLPRALAWCVEQVVIRYAKELIGVQETRYLMDAMEATHAELVKELQRQVQVNRVTEVLQRLVEEGVSIRDMRTIFETLIMWASKEKDIVTLTEYVRIALKRHIVNRHITQGITKVWVVGGNIETMVRESIRQTVSGAYSALDPEANAKIIAVLKEQLKDSPRGILLTALDVRRYIRKIVEAEFFNYSVLSYQEVSDVRSFNIQGSIDLVGGA